MHLNFSKKAIKALAITTFIVISSQSLARTIEPHNTTCYGVSKDDKMSFKSSCRVEGGGGTGIYSEVYSLKGRKYNITYVEDEVTMNDRPVQVYGRNAAFSRVPVSDTGKNYIYHCYKSRQGHFCTK